MGEVYKITVIVNDSNKKHEFELLFDEKNRAERFVTAIKAVLSKKGKANVSFKGEIVPVFNNDDDILKAFTAIDF